MQNLKQRIFNGRKWLLENVDHPKYKEALQLYESLVDEASKNGIKETDCWVESTDTMPIDQIKSLFEPA